MSSARRLVTGQFPASGDTGQARATVSTHRRTPNLLLIGPDSETRAFLDRQMASLPSSIGTCAGAELQLPSEPAQSLVLRDVEQLTRDHQDQLVEWLNGPGFHTRIVATSGAPLYPMVERGEFSDALYYRINIVTLRLDDQHKRQKGHKGYKGHRGEPRI
jgi:hypothetical protein